jgi:outer membrane protein assembly factor BamB
MRRLRFRLLWLGSVWFLASLARSAAPSGFEGVWLGEIVAPNTRTPLGLAFTPTEKGLLVSVHLPEMFLYSVNFGAAQIEGDTFTLAPLQLSVTRRGDVLAGTFALAHLPVELRRTEGSFTAPPPEPDFPPAPAPVWSRTLGAAAWAPPAVRDGVVYVAGVDGALHAARASVGERVWTWRGPHPLYGEPLVTDDAVYLVDDATDLVCLARDDGSLRWRVALHDANLAGGAAPKNETFNHRATSPVIDAKGNLYVGSTDRGLYAVRAKTGKVLWRHDAQARIYAPVALQDDAVIAACFDGSVFAVDRRRGRTEKFRVKLGGPLVAAPVLAGQRIILGGRDYLLYGLDARNGTPQWRDSYWFSWVESTPRLVDGVLYIGGSDFRRISAINPGDGRTLWATDVRGLSWGSPVVTGDAVFAGTAGQHLADTVIKHTGGVVKLDRATGAVLWRYLAPTPENADFTGFAGSLVLSDDLVIGASVDGTLMAFPARSAP